ncbi:MAG: methylisocitrate lyase [Pirellulaceae bacterium]|nr:methylisocitrate lyase [Planctomycetaceae bacterium]MDG1807058.1 methylisocitrate lyase [Pirellulaceae bacterium]MDG2104590.1 methylisocitrate lyase [Pirellulaceae bacterium]
MTQISSAGTRFRHSLELEKPLQIVGTINAYCALMAEQAGFQAIYLSGAGVANASFGVPDLGITTINDVVADIQRIVGATQLPLLVDADTGFGHAFSMARTIREFTRAGAAGVHIEDQVAAKRCGHRPGKELVDTAEMVDRIHAAVDARTDESFFIMARTDALASEGMEATLERCHKYVEAGADGIFAEAVREADQYQKFTQALSVPVLANMTEFGQSPLLTAEQLGDLGIAMVLYPLSAFRAMNAAAERVYSAIRKERTQDTVVDLMQTRDRLYEVLDYHRYEQQIDDLIRKSEK